MDRTWSRLRRRPASRRRADSDAKGTTGRVVYDGKTVRVRDAKGMHYLARLLADPGREFHALDLAGDGVASASVGVADESGMAIGDVGDAGIRLDAEAKSAYRARLQELQDEAAQAEAWNDIERAARAQQEIAFLTDELKGAVGLGGRDRREASAAERARLSVTRALRSAIVRIGEQHAAAWRPSRRDHPDRHVLLLPARSARANRLGAVRSADLPATM